MVLASGIRRLWGLGAACIVLVAVAIAAQSARADTRVVKGGDTTLYVNVPDLVRLWSDGIQITPIAPATIDLTAGTSHFPVGTGVADAALKTATVTHNGGLRLTKAKINQTIDATNITLACLPVVGCRILNTANNLLPNELAELRDVTWSDNGNGTVTVFGSAYVGPVTALALNTLFQSNAFYDGMFLGNIRSELKY